MVKKRGFSKKKKISEKRTNLKGKKASKKKKILKTNKQTKLKTVEDKNRGFFSRLFLGAPKEVKNKSGGKGNSVKTKSSKINLKPDIKSVEKNKGVEKNKKIKRVIKNLKKEFSEKKLRSENIETKKKSAEKFVRTGMKGFDALFEKNMGIPNGNSILIEGGPGSGKTIFCLATLNELCKEGEKCLYMSFEESEEQLIAHMEEFGWKPKEFIKKGLLRITRFDAIDISRSIEALLSAAKKELLIEVEPMFFPEDFKPDFVIMDSLTSIASAFTGEESRFRIYMEQLFRYLEKNNITNFLIREVSSPSHVGTTFKEQGEAVSFLSDGIIVLYNVVYDSGDRTFALEILKMRGVSFKHRIVEFKIVNKKGLEVNPNKILKKSRKSNFSLT
ncbi:MAG: ATPase domain-containing protein [archaeon]